MRTLIALALSLASLCAADFKPPSTVGKKPIHGPQNRVSQALTGRAPAAARNGKRTATKGVSKTARRRPSKNKGPMRLSR